MGRYYSGDIEGKFWFGIQSSTDAEFFGGEGYQPEEMNYWFEKSDLDTIKEVIHFCCLIFFATEEISICTALYCKPEFAFYVSRVISTHVFSPFHL